MMPPKLLRCIDIWNEILSYFEIFLDNDEATVIKEKKKSIFAIALLSRELKEVGLDALWRNMTSLVPVVNVANSVKKGLEYRVSNGKGCWRVRHRYIIYNTNVRNRITNYLKRVRSLHVQITAKELELWQLLYDILLRPVQILPSIQNVSLQSTAETTTLPFLWVISNIFGPSLTSITVKGKWEDSWDTVEHFMKCSDMPNVRRLSFSQAYLPRFPSCIYGFKRLQELSIFDDDLTLDIGIFGFINKLHCLQKLEISIGTTKDPAGVAEPSNFPTLQVLKLHIRSPLDFIRFLQVTKIPGLTDLKVIIRDDWSNDLLPLQSMVAAYPSLQRLYITRVLPMKHHQYDWTLTDLVPLMKVRGMKSMNLIDIPHKLSEKDVSTLLESWPELRSLSITSKNTVFASTLLTSLHQFPPLRKISLPLDLSSLTSHISSEHTPQSTSRLFEIFSPRSSGIPDKSHDKLRLVRKLQTLFPELESISGNDESIKDLGLLLATANRLYN